MKCDFVYGERSEEYIFLKKEHCAEKNHFITQEEEDGSADDEDYDDNAFTNDFCKKTSLLVTIENLDFPVCVPFDYNYAHHLSRRYKKIDRVLD